MASVERGGVASVYVDGAYYEVSAEIEITLGGVTRASMVKSDGVAGFTTKFVAPEIKLEAIDGPAVSVAGILAISGQTLQVAMNNGKQYLLYDATQVDQPGIKVHDGKISDVKFTGSACIESLPS